MASNNTNAAAAAAALRQGFFDIMGYYPDLAEQRDDASEQEPSNEANQNSAEAAQEPPTTDPSGATAAPADSTEIALPPDWFVQAFGMDENTNPFEAGAQDSSSTAQPAQEEAASDQDDYPANSGFDVSTQAPPTLTNQSSPRFPPSTSAPFAHPPPPQAPLHPSFGQLGGAPGSQPSTPATLLGLESIGPSGEVVTAGPSTAAPEPASMNNAVSRGPLPSSPALPVAQPANSTPMTESERRARAAAQGRVVPPLRRVPLTPETRGKSGPKPGNRRQRLSNFDSQPGSASSASPLVAPNQGFANFPAGPQPTQQARPVGPQDVVDLTNSPPPTRAPLSTGAPARAQDSPSSSPSSASGSSGKKRKAREPRGEANKRAKLLAGMASSTERTTQEMLAWFKRPSDTPMPADFSTRGENAMQQVATPEDAEKVLRQESSQIRYYKLRIAARDEDVQLVEGEIFENVRRTILAAIQHPPTPAPAAHPFKEAYDHNHECQYKDLMSKLVNDQNHVVAAAKILKLIDKVMDVHRRGIPMAELNAAKFDSQEKIESAWLPEDAETRSCKTTVDQNLSCIKRLGKIVEAIRVNKWIANDIMKGKSGEDWMVLICNPAECLELKASNWESNNKKKLQKEAAERAKRASGPEVIALDDDE